MKTLVSLVLLMLLINLINTGVHVKNNLYKLSDNLFNLDLNTSSNLTLLYVFSGNITNTGNESLLINKTDIMIFDYPLNTDDQVVYKVQTFVNNIEYNYTIVEVNNTKYIYIVSPYNNSTVDPGGSINVSVMYFVNINMTKRISSIIDFYQVNDPYKLLNKSGRFSDLYEYANESTIGLTNLWNYTNPLVKLLVKYLNKSIVSDKPLFYLLDILNWIDKNIIYSTRIPPRAPWEVIVEGAGDCDDQSNLLITLLRAFRIPCFLEIGIVYISDFYRIQRSEAGGYYSYEFRGGGGHGWVVVYIPPWGWIRVDPIVRSDPFTGEKAPLYKVGIKYALFYIFPTIILDRIFEKNYVEESVKFIEEIKTKKIMIRIIIEVYKLEE